MSSQLQEKMGVLSLNGEVAAYKRTPFGKEMLQHFFFAGFKNLNHGSYGAFPRAIQQKQRALQDLCESRPDPFIRYVIPEELDKSREAIAKVLNCPVDTVVFVPNATTAVNTVLRNLVWEENGKDEILYFRHIYGACLKTVEYICESSRGLVTKREMHVIYPMEDADLVKLFKDTIKASKAEGKKPRIAIFDTVSSMPGLRMPFEDLTAVCKEEGVLSLIDAAHGVGNISLDLTSLDPDFLVSNAHKWLFVPRGCAVFFVPFRNQSLMRSSLPTSHGFIPKGPTTAWSSLPPSTKSEFVYQFESTGTMDYSNSLVIAEAIKWREEVCGGEQAIRDYCINLTRNGGKLIAERLGTKIMDNKTKTLSECCLVNILLPISISPIKIAGTTTVKPEHVSTVANWMQESLIGSHKTFIAIYYFQEQWWARMSGQVYLDISDFEWAANVLKELCDRVGNEEFLADSKGKGNL